MEGTFRRTGEPCRILISSSLAGQAGRGLSKIDRQLLARLRSFIRRSRRKICKSAYRVRRGKAALFPVGESPTRQPLQPEATGATMEVTKWLKPLVKRVTNW